MTDDLPTNAPGASASFEGLRLQHRHGSRAGTAHDVREGVVNLGRRDGLEVRLDREQDFLVSGMHARIFQGAGADWYIEDVGSTNGTFLGGVRLENPHRLHSGDVVVLGAATESDGAVSFEVLVAGEAPRSPAPAQAPVGSTPAAAAEPVVHQPPAADSRHEEGGVLGFGRIRGAIARFKDRRELQKRLDANRAQLDRHRSDTEQSCLALGIEAWKSPSVPRGSFPAEQGVAAFQAELEALVNRLDDSRQELLEAREQFAEHEAVWRTAHDRLTAEAQRCDEACVAAAGARVAADAAVLDVVQPRFDRLAELRQAIGDLLEAQIDPSPDVLREAADLGDRLRAVADLCSQPVPDFEARVAERRRCRDAEDAARAAVEQAQAEVERSRAEHQPHVQSLAERERQQSQAEAGHGQAVKDLETRHAAAFVALGQAAADSGQPAVPGLTSGPRAIAALGALRELEQGIAADAAALAQLGS